MVALDGATGRPGSFDGPGLDPLTTLLDDRAQGKGFRAGCADIQGQPRLLREFPTCHGERVLSFFDLTLGNRPGSPVARGKKRTARMDEENLRAAGQRTKEKDPRTLSPSADDRCLPGVCSNRRRLRISQAEPTAGSPETDWLAVRSRWRAWAQARKRETPSTVERVRREWKTSKACWAPGISA